MPTLEVLPHGGLNKRFPIHKLTGEKIQKVRELKNLLSLSGKIYKVGGATKYNTAALPGFVQWAKRIYYISIGDNRRHTFAEIENKLYKGDDTAATLTQVKIDDAYTTLMKGPVLGCATLQVSGVVSTFLVDGTYFYKFNGNTSGDWDRLPVKSDIDGNTIYPIDIAEYLDRAFVLTANRNELLCSANLNPESYDDSTDCLLLQLPPGNGGYPKRVILHPNGFLHIIHQDYIAPLSGYSVGTFGITPGDVIHGWGTNAPKSVIRIGNTFGFLNSKDNEYYLFSNLAQPLSWEIEFSKLVNPSKANETVAFFDRQLNAIRLSYVPAGGTTLSKEIIYSLTESKWCGETEGRNVSCYCPYDGDGDQGELLTGRSDTGALMVNDNSKDFDGAAIQYKLVTGFYAAKNFEECQFEDFYVDLKAGVGQTVTLNYYLDSRHSIFSTESVSMRPEIFVLGAIEISQQDIVLGRVVPFIDYSKGRMISFELTKNATGTEFEFYGLYGNFNVQSKYFSSRVGGAPPEMVAP